VDWTGPLGILIGGMIGAGSTILADVARWRRQRTETDRATRREVYSRFLEALTSTDSELQLLAIENPTPVPEAATREVWRRNSVLSLSYEVQLIAPGPVVHASINAYMRLRALRNAVRTTRLTVGNTVAFNIPSRANEFPGSREWIAVHRPYVDALDALREEMRKDIHG
jgi:hypothetical protein